MRGGQKIDLGRRSPWCSGGRTDHHCGEARVEQTRTCRQPGGGRLYSSSANPASNPNPAHNNIGKEVSLLLAFTLQSKSQEVARRATIAFAMRGQRPASPGNGFVRGGQGGGCLTRQGGIQGQGRREIFRLLESESLVCLIILL